MTEHHHARPKRRPHPDVDIDGARAIEVGGVRHFIPVLPLRQTMKIVPLIAEIRSLDARTITEEQVAKAARIVHIALTRAYPGITIEEVEDEMTFAEMLAGVKVIIDQTTAFERGDAAAGEAWAAGPSTGTDSSPIS